MAVQLDKETTQRLLGQVKRFAADELDLDLGDLKAGLVLDFFLHHVAPAVYNQAVADAARFLEEKAADLPGVLHASEGPSSAKGRQR